MQQWEGIEGRRMGGGGGGGGGGAPLFCLPYLNSCVGAIVWRVQWVNEIWAICSKVCYGVHW